MLPLSVTALFYLDNSRKIHLPGMRACRSKDVKRRAPHRAGERERRGLWLLFLYVSLPLDLSYVNWASQECCLFYLRFSLQSSDLPLFYICGLFPSRSFSHRHSGLLFPILTTQHFKQFLPSFSFKHITGIPYNPQAQDTVEQTHHTLKLQIEKIKEGGIHRYTIVFLI